MQNRSGRNYSQILKKFPTRPPETIPRHLITSLAKVQPYDATQRNKRSKLSVISRVLGVTSSICYTTYCQTGEGNERKYNKRVERNQRERRGKRPKTQRKVERSQTSHEPLIRRLNTADVFCRCNIIIFSMRA